MTDPISDMFNRILNAQGVSKAEVSIPFSNLKLGIAQILEKNKFIEKIGGKGKKVNRFIELVLKYEDKIPAISGIKRVSKPGQRIYTSASDIKRVKDGYGIAIISTSKGLMTGNEARKLKLGGELICHIW